MSLLTRASGRHLARHPGQLALSVLGVALGVAVVVSIDLAIESARAAFRASAETVAGRATHVVSGATGSVDEALVAEIRVGLGVRPAAPVLEGFATSPRLPGRVLRVLGVDPFSEAPFRSGLVGLDADVDVGRMVTVPGGVVLSGAMAREIGVAVGGSFPVRVDGRTRSLVVVGVVEVVGPAASGTRDLLLVDIATAQDLLASAGRVTRVDLRIPDDAGGAAALERIGSLLPGDARLEEAGTRARTLSGMIRAFDLNLTALSLLALVFGAFLIYNAMTFSVVQRRELLGGLRALGVTRAELLRTVLVEAAAIGVAGSVAGAALGVALGRGLVGMVTRTVNDLYFVVSLEDVRISWTALAAGTALGVVATLLAAIPAALEAATAPPRLSRLRSAVEERARRLVPRAALTGAGLCGAGATLLLGPWTSLAVGFAGLSCVVLGAALLTPAGTVLLVRVARPLLGRTAGILGTMAARGVVAALSRTAPAIAALVVAVAVTVGLGVMIESFRGTLTRWLDATLQADLYVSLPSVLASRADGTLDAAVVEALRAHPAVAGSSTYRGSELRLGDRIARLLALDLDPRGEASLDFVEGGGTEGFAAFRSRAAAFVSEPLSWRLGLGVGDTLDLPTPFGVRRAEVAGVFYDYGSDQGTVMVSRASYDAWFDDPGVTSLGLFLHPAADRDSVVAELERAAASVADQAVVVRTNAALRAGSLEVFERTFRVTSVLRLLAFVVAFVGVLSALMAVELERAREMGVLRANGLTPGQLWRLVTTQTGLMGLIAGVLSLPLGIVLSVVMVEVVNKRSFGWSLRLEVPPQMLLQAVGLAFAGALLAGVVPAWRMARTSPGAALRGE